MSTGSLLSKSKILVIFGNVYVPLSTVTEVPSHTPASVSNTWPCLVMEVAGTRVLVLGCSITKAVEIPCSLKSSSVPAVPLM